MQDRGGETNRVKPLCGDLGRSPGRAACSFPARRLAVSGLCWRWLKGLVSCSGTDAACEHMLDTSRLGTVCTAATGLIDEAMKS